MADKLLYTVQDYRKKRVIIDTDAVAPSGMLRHGSTRTRLTHTPKKARR